MGRFISGSFSLIGKSAVNIPDLLIMIYLADFLGFSNDFRRGYWIVQLQKSI